MIAVVCHDAGGAQIVSSWILHQDEPCCICVAGPAIEIFRNKLGEFENLELGTALQKCDWVLCGTSWQSELEINALKLAASLGKNAVAFLDHWVCYRERFERGTELTLPEEVWVNDVYAEKIAVDVFPGIKILKKKNYYFEDLKTVLANNNLIIEGGVENKGKSVLYICEPLSVQALKQYGDEKYWGYTEQEALEYFLLNRNVIDPGINKIALRLHPAEGVGKYDDIIAAYSGLMETGGNKSLINEIIESDILVGCESMAMVVGLLAGKRVVSCIPPGGKPSELPHIEIENLQTLITKLSTIKNV